MKLICINCPRGCEMDVEVASGTVTVSGNGCPRGEAYARSEATNSMRTVTGLVRVEGTRKPLPIKTKSPVPKAKIEDVLLALRRTTVRPPITLGQIVIPDVAETGVDVVATADSAP